MTEFVAKKILVFGSSSNKTAQHLLDGSFQLGELIAESGHVLVFGGGRMGCMGAVQNGSFSKGGRIIGVIHEVFLPGNQTTGRFEQLLIASGPTLTDRKRLLYENCDAIIVLPGGVGTFDELFETTCLRALKMNNFHNIPICLLNINGFFDHTVLQMQRAAEDGVLYGDVESYFHVANSPRDALDWTLGELASAKATAISDTDEKGHGQST
jgi:uncharacterized protein (TIGR00730 family)